MRDSHTPRSSDRLCHLVVIVARYDLALRTQRALFAASHHVEVASTMRRGQAILCHRPPDAIVLDQLMTATQPADYGALLAAARAARVPLLMLEQLAGVEPAVLAVEPGEGALPVFAQPLARSLIEHLRHLAPAHRLVC